MNAWPKPVLLSHRLVRGSPSKGPPTIILHGFLGGKRNWRSVARILSERTGNLILADQRNHGDSPHSETHSHDAMAADVFHLADHLGLDTFSLIGHSQGGKTAMHAALSCPDRIHKLVIVDTTPTTYTLDEFHTYFERMNEIVAKRVSSPTEAESILAQGITEPLIRRFLLTNLKPQTDGTLAFIVNLPVLEHALRSGVTAGFPVHAPGVRFQGPTLVVRGARSAYVKGDRVGVLMERFPTAVIRDMDTAHWVHHERPREFANIVGEFLSLN
ncbi:Abhydrolase domain-containing protein C22H12.03 [Chytriomyces sp. MP71]|nr:Abhydrolase domain-containing protein C22H12.03 [Chytriomyces sp. MP71]